MHIWFLKTTMLALFFRSSEALLPTKTRLLCSLRHRTLYSSLKETVYPNFSFTIHKQDPNSNARTAIISTPHGKVETPNFVFCATKASMKGVSPAQLRDEGTQIILSNTYHLLLAPGADVIDKMGGLQKFTAWHGPMLTDSGGFQIFSMGCGTIANEIKGNRKIQMEKKLLGIDEDGATFLSYVDGNAHKLTPELSIEVQRKLGADLIVVLDECTPFNVDYNYTAESTRRSHRWALRSLKEFERTASGKQALYGIVQGGVYDELRDESADFINNHSFFGTAIGGSLGATKQEMHRIISYTRSRVRNDRPVHLLGIGGVIDIFHGVRQGIDTFDCVHPSRIARHGGALVLAAHWEETPWPSVNMQVEQARLNVEKKMQKKLESRALGALHLRKEIEKKKNDSRNNFRNSTSTRNNSTGNMNNSLVDEYDMKGSIRTNGMNNCDTNINTTNTNTTLGEAAINTKQHDNDTTTTANDDHENVDNNCVSTTTSSSATANNNNNDDDNNTSSTTASSTPTTGTEVGYFRSRRLQKKLEPLRVREHISLYQSSFREDPRPIDSTCSCYTCKHFSRAYISHLFRANEMLSGTLVRYILSNTVYKMIKIVSYVYVLL